MPEDHYVDVLVREEQAPAIIIKVFCRAARISRGIIIASIDV